MLENVIVYRIPNHIGRLYTKHIMKLSIPTHSPSAESFPNQDHGMEVVDADFRARPVCDDGSRPGVCSIFYVCVYVYVSVYVYAYAYVFLVP